MKRLVLNSHSDHTFSVCDIDEHVLDRHEGNLNISYINDAMQPTTTTRVDLLPRISTYPTTTSCKRNTFLSKKGMKNVEEKVGKFVNNTTTTTQLYIPKQNKKLCRNGKSGENNKTKFYWEPISKATGDKSLAKNNKNVDRGIIAF